LPIQTKGEPHLSHIASSSESLCSITTLSKFDKLSFFPTYLDGFFLVYVISSTSGSGAFKSLFFSASSKRDS